MPTQLKLLLFLFFVFSLCIVGTGTVLYNKRSKELLLDKQIELSTIAELKVHQIDSWRKERIIDAQEIQASSLLRENLRKLSATRKDSAVYSVVQEALLNIQRNEQYNGIFLLDAQGKKILAVPNNSSNPDSIVIATIKTSKEPNILQFCDLHVHQGSDSATMEMIVPFRVSKKNATDTTPDLFLVIAINPYQYLFSYVQQWPTSSKSSETLLLRKDGDSVTYLHDLRHQKNTMFKLHIPVFKPHFIGGEAVTGIIPFDEGVDYRNRPVLAAMRHIPDSPWYLVAKTDKDEFYTPLRVLLHVIMGFSIVLILIGGIVAIMIQRHNAARHFKDMFLRKQEELKFQKELREKDERFQALFTTMTEGVALHELVRDNAGIVVNYKIIDSNPAFTIHTGFSRELAVNKLATELYGTNEPPYLEIYGNVAETGNPYYFETFFPPMNKHFSISVFSPGKNQFATVFEDITERKTSEQLFAQEKERLAVTLRSIGDGVITTDMSGKITMLNRAAEELTEWTTLEALGKPLPEVFVIVNEFTRQPCENPVEKVLKSGIIVELANHTLLITKSGRELVIADSGAPIRDRESNIIGVVLVFRDTTEKQRLSDSMQRTQKLESIGVLAGGIAHDFNNLLFGLFGYLDLAQESLKHHKPVQAHESLSKAIEVFNRAKALTKQLLIFSKGGTPVRKNVQLKNCIQTSTQFALSGSNVTCICTIANDLWQCNCDENQIAQVIDNIVINAKQAMPLGGTIQVAAKNQFVVAGEFGQYKYTGEFLHISIQDSGIGIPKELLPRIFDPFFSTKETGHGLGLATVHSIIYKHDGFLDVDSEPGKGSTFHIFLPRSTTQEKESDPAHSNEFSGKGQVLVLDDEDFMRDILGKVLESLGYTVTKVKNGEEALEQYNLRSQTNEPFVFSILDLTIPGGMGGRETVTGILQINDNAVVIASSGYSEDPIMADPVSFGFSASIIKPYRKEDLIKLLSKLFSSS